MTPEHPRASRINLDYRRAPLRFIDLEPTHEIREIARLPLGTFPEQTTREWLPRSRLHTIPSAREGLVSAARRKILLEGLFVTNLVAEDAIVHVSYRPCATPEEEQVVRDAVAEQARIKAPLAAGEPLILDENAAQAIARAAATGLPYLTTTYPDTVHGSHHGISRTVLDDTIRLSITPFTYKHGPSQGRPTLRISDERRGTYLPYFNAAERQTLEHALREHLGAAFAGLSREQHNLVHVSAYLEVEPHPGLRAATRSHAGTPRTPDARTQRLEAPAPWR